jgi:CheY-like chemotaxis protein
VLVVDDNRDAAQLLAEALDLMGHDTRIALDGPAALDAAAAFQPDVALLDLGLPVMDGFELAECLRAAPRLQPIALIAVTGYGQETDHERSRAAGFEAHIVKPVDLQLVNQVLDEIARRVPPAV